MKVTILAHEWPPVNGGAGSALKGMLLATDALRDEFDVDMTVVVPSSGTRAVDVDWPVPRRVTMRYVVVGKRLHFASRPLAAVRWFRRLRIPECDVLHVWGAMPNVWPAAKQKAPFILTLHGSDVPGRNPAWSNRWPFIGRSYRKRWRKAAAITAVTERLAELAGKFSGMDVQVVPNGVTLPEVEVRTEPHRPLRLLMVTRIHPLRDVHLGVQIATLMGDEAEMTVVGDGPDMVFYNTGVKRVRFVGWQSDVEPFYRAADIFVNTANATGWTCSALEARSYGLPVVSRYVPNAVPEGGIVTAPANAHAMIAAIRRVADNYPEYAEQALRGRESLDWSVRARPYFQLYRKVSQCNSTSVVRYDRQ